MKLLLSYAFNLREMCLHAGTSSLLQTEWPQHKMLSYRVPCSHEQVVYELLTRRWKWNNVRKHENNFSHMSL